MGAVAVPGWLQCRLVAASAATAEKAAARLRRFASSKRGPGKRASERANKRTNQRERTKSGSSVRLLLDWLTGSRKKQAKFY